jgi:hypothetical protein
MFTTSGAFAIVAALPDDPAMIVAANVANASRHVERAKDEDVATLLV